MFCTCPKHQALTWLAHAFLHVATSDQSWQNMWKETSPTSTCYAVCHEHVFHAHVRHILPWRLATVMWLVVGRRTSLHVANMVEHGAMHTPKTQWTPD